MRSRRYIAGLFVWALIATHSAAQAGIRSSGDYSIIADSLDGGGIRITGANYDNAGCLGELGGVLTNSSSDNVVKDGYAGQLLDATNIMITADPSTLNEGNSGQLTSLAQFDDGTFLPAANDSIRWLSPAYPLLSITEAGGIVADIVYASAGGTATGIYLGATGSVTVMVMDTHPDNFRSYAGDTIADSWQVAYFGEENADGLYDADPDGDLQNNLDEYITGTSPNDHMSYFKLWNEIVLNVSTQGDILYHPRLDGRLYELRRSTDLTNTAWTTSFLCTQSLNDATCTVRDLNIPTETMYYRVKVMRAPTNCGYFVSLPLPTVVNQAGFSVTLADFNKDGVLDACVGNDRVAQVLFTTNNGFYPIITDSGQRLGTSLVYGVASGDVNGDSNVDVITVGPDGGRVWYNDGAGLFTGSVWIITNSYCSSVAVGDLNGDGYNDLFVGRGSAASGFKNLVLTNNGDGVFGLVDQTSFILDKTFGVALGDLDNDGDLDAYVANSVANRCYRNDGKAHFSLWGTDSRSDDSRGVAIADMNGDGYRDVVVANAWPGPSVVYLNSTNGVFQPFPLDDYLGDAVGVAVADLDGDLRPDIITAGWGDSAIWLNLDGTNFSRSVQSLGYDFSQAVAVGDMNNDSAADFVVVNYNTTNTLWLNECMPP